MRIAIAQLNYTVNHFRLNQDKILAAIQRAKRENADLVVFSELSVCGYPPHDLLDRRDFVATCIESVHQIAKSCYGIAAIVGAPSLNPNPQGKLLYNSAYVLQRGTVSSIHHKTLLPTYDVFDEYRYFEPNSDFSIAQIDGENVAITICEDLWDDQPVSSSFARNRLYKVSPMERLSSFNPKFVVNIAASPFSYNSEDRRLRVFTGNVNRFKLPVVYVNQVGANADLIFDGGSMVLNSKGDVLEHLASFGEDFRVIDTATFNQTDPPIARRGDNEPIARIHDALVMGIRDYFRKMGFERATLGLSGGIDSAVTLVLAEKALGAGNIRVLLLPSQYSSQHSVDDAIALASRLNVRYDVINIKGVFESFRESLRPIFAGLQEDITEENLQARIRGTLMMALSNKFGHLLLNTSNKSEAAVGYGTLYGDMNGALSVLGDVYKTDVYQLAHYINRNGEIIPANTIQKPPSAELRPDQKDSDSLPEYGVLDQILFMYIEEQRNREEIVDAGFDPHVVDKALRLVNISEYKRHQAPPILRVSSKAFGFGRKMPLVAYW
jgi:NAD+ synthase (glutamine-hydrolysing)